MAYHLSHTSEILIFLLGAMTIVEIIDYYNGFEKIKSFIRTKSRKKMGCNMASSTTGSHLCNSFVIKTQNTFNLDVFSLKNHAEFEDAVFQLFHYQFEKNKVYRAFCNLINSDPNELSSLNQIPFLPISFSKHTG